MGLRHSAEREMTNPPSLNLVEFRRRIQAGDLILISSRSVIESDIAIPPQLLQSVKFTIKQKFSISRDIRLPVWDTAAIVVDMDLSPNAGKCILELTDDGFVVSEFISRMTEIKKKGYEMCVRFLEGPKNNEFRQSLMALSEYLAGKSLDELAGSPLYNEVKRPVEEYIDDINRESSLHSQLKEAFYMVVTDPDEMTITKAQLHELMREFTGTNMDLSVDELADSLNFRENMNFQEFYKCWAEGPGREVLNEEVYAGALLNGQFIKHAYRVLGLVQENQWEISTPDDFATNYENLNALRNTNLMMINGFRFTVQYPVKL
jgi:hypothetical protein